MNLTSSQKTALKNHIDANTAVVDLGGVPTEIKDVPNTLDTNGIVADWYNAEEPVAFWVWRSTLTRSDVYHKPGPENTFWNWDTFKGQSVAEQNAWVQMFMGDAAPVQNLNFRDGVRAVFSGSVPQTTQRDHIFAASRRKSNRVEKILAAAPIAIGSISPIATNGNNLGAALGGTTNPAVMGAEGQLTPSDVTSARTTG